LLFIAYFSFFVIYYIVYHYLYFYLFIYILSCYVLSHTTQQFQRKTSKMYKDESL